MCVCVQIFMYEYIENSYMCVHKHTRTEHTIFITHRKMWSKNIIFTFQCSMWISCFRFRVRKCLPNLTSYNATTLFYKRGSVVRWCVCDSILVCIDMFYLNFFSNIIIYLLQCVVSSSCSYPLYTNVFEASRAHTSQSASMK